MSQSAHPEGLSMLEKRKIEAEILKKVYETLKESHGEAVAKKTIAESVRRSAIEQARAFAAAAPGGTSLKAFQDVMPLWTKGGALEIEVKEQSDKSFAFNVVRCRYAETYKAMGLGRDRPPAVVQPRRRVLRRLRPQAQARAHADHHAGREPLRLQVHVRK
jgi:L-2-amino-thiazoline-4-carboxylic acid hydrolase-like protein